MRADDRAPAGPVATGASVRAARIAVWAWGLSVAADVARSLTYAILRVLYERQPSLGFETIMRVQRDVAGASAATVVVADAAIAIALARFARTLQKGTACVLARLAAVAAGTVAASVTLSWIANLGHLVATVAEGLSSVMAAAAIGLWLGAGLRVLGSIRSRLPLHLTTAIVAALAARLALDGWLDLSQSTLDGSLRFDLLERLAEALSLFGTVGAAAVALHVWRGLRRAREDGEADSKAGPYRESDRDEAALAAHDASFGVAGDVALHTVAAMAYAGAAVIGIALSMFTASWHKFYATCEILRYVGSLNVVALVTMLLCAPRRDRGTKDALLLGALVAEILRTAIMLQLFHFMDQSREGDAFWTRLHERDALFSTAETLGVVARVAAMAALALQARSYAARARRREDPSLASQADRVAFFVGALAVGDLAALGLSKTDAGGLAIVAESAAESPAVRSVMLVAVVALMLAYGRVTRRLLRAGEAGRPERSGGGDAAGEAA